MSSNSIFIILISVISFFITTLITPIIIRFSFKNGALDYPKDRTLQIHINPTPILGGTAIFCGILPSWLFSAIYLKEFQKEIFGFLTGALLILVLGLVDDLKGVKPNVRLLGEMLVALAVIFISGLTVNIIPYLYISIPITVLYLLAVMNAVNLLDGIDGIATGTSMIACGGFLAAFFLVGNNLGILLSLSLMGTTGAFLIYNFNPAKIFLGDNGSTLLGLFLGVLAVLFSSKPYSFTHFLVPVFIIIVPVLDTGLAINRRIRKSKSIFHGDRNHFYDQLMKKGFSQKQTSLLTYLFGLLGAIAGIYFLIF